MATDFYDLLGVGREASAEELKKAYRRLARTHHPDLNPGNAEAEASFKEISRAYETLSDPTRRARYDRFGDEDRSSGGFDPFGGAGGGLGDLFDAFFGGGSAFGGRTAERAGPQRGVDLESVADLAFVHAVFGTKHDVEVRTAVACEECQASGATPGTQAARCTDCGGSGQVRRVRQSILGQMVSSAPCNRCAGQGQVIVSPCQACKGEGRVVVTRSYPVDIPPGVDDGTTLRLTGRGAVGPRGGGAGDLYVHVRVRPDGTFRRDGFDLHRRFELSVAQAALGASLSCETLDGTETLNVTAGTQSGEVVRFRGAGVPHLQARGRGDLLVELIVLTPTALVPEEEELLRRLATLRGEEVAEPDQGFLARIKSAFR